MGGADLEPDAREAEPRPASSRKSRPPAGTTQLEPLDTSFLKNLKHDLPASLVVFLVALPLCLGIAVASGAPPLAGLIAGVIGGIVVGSVSGSSLAVSGPAAGLTTIVLGAIGTLGYEAFLLAVCMAGVIQIVLGFARAGVFAYYFPSSVIKGMLAAIGLSLIIKQIPHALGHDLDFEGNLTLVSDGHLGPIEAITAAFGHVNVATVAIALIGLGVLIVWDNVPTLRRIKWLPAPLLVVGLGIGLNALLGLVAPEMRIAGDHLVSIPTGGLDELWAEMSFPAFNRIGDRAVWTAAATIAAVASIETLLSIEAIDKLDPFKRSTPTNRELVAQGTGNLLSGLIGGLPLTAVIVRGSTNVQSGARTKASSIMHGVLLIAAVLLLPWVMNLIPLAALAAVLLHVGYKLANFGLFRHMFRQSVDTWVPFVVTVVAILFTDLLIGVGVGVVVGIFFILRANLATPFFIHRREAHQENEHSHILIELSENVSFLNKASVNRMLQELPRQAVVEIDGTGSQYIHPDVLELIHEFDSIAHTRGIRVELKRIPRLERGPAH